MSASRNGELGESLVELLVSIVIMGIAFPSILGALAISNKGSGQHREQTELATALRAAAEAVQDTTTNPWPAGPACPTSFTVPSSATVTVTPTYGFYDADDSVTPWKSDQTWVPTSANGCQLMRVKLQASDGKGNSESVTVTRRRP